MIDPTLDETLALLTNRNSDGSFNVVLYDHNVVNTRLSSGLCVPHKVVTAAIETRRCDGIECVSYVVAKHGYGPFVYDVAMQNCEHGLAPDRYWVARAAQRVWEHYATRRTDVSSVSLPADAKLHDVWYLDKVYSCHSSHDVTGLVKRHFDIMSVHGDVTTVLRSVALARYNRKK